MAAEGKVPLWQRLWKWKGRQSVTSHEINLESITSVNGDSLPQVPEETTELDVHYVSLYDKFLQYKEACCAYTRERVMRFMRHELENEAEAGEGGDVEGGSGAGGPKPSNATYDSLIFKVTLLVGFLLRFPLMWVMGSILFLCSNNFKKTTIRWGSINIFFAIASICYACQRWRKLDLFTIEQPHPASTVFINMINNVEFGAGKNGSGSSGSSGGLVVNGKACNYFDIEPSTALEWLEHRSDAKEEDLNLSGKSFKSAGQLGVRGLIYEAGRVGGKTDYALIKNYQLLVGGKFQIAASMAVDPTQEYKEELEAVKEPGETFEDVANVLREADATIAVAEPPTEPTDFIWTPNGSQPGVSSGGASPTMGFSAGTLSGGEGQRVKGSAPEPQDQDKLTASASGAAKATPLVMHKIKHKTLPQLGNLATTKPATFDFGLVCTAKEVDKVYWATLKAKTRGTVAKVFQLPIPDTYTCHFVCANHHSLAIKHVYIRRV